MMVFYLDAIVSNVQEEVILLLCLWYLTVKAITITVPG